MPDHIREVRLIVTMFLRPLLAIAVSAGLSIATASAQEAALPGGASSLREAHGDWMVNCTIAGSEDQARKVCAMSQEQTDSNSGQRVIAMELQPGETASNVTLLLPFGLDLAAGAALQIDDGATG